MFYRKTTVSDQKRYWLNIVVFGIDCLAVTNFQFYKRPELLYEAE